MLYSGQKNEVDQLTIYGGNFSRLREGKRVNDPFNLFKFKCFLPLCRCFVKFPLSNLPKHYFNY
ncbi:BBE domain-containing protein [Gottfriedia acidiceleris]|uniref:BBE domain-containing protein n=1 Tax=Gottfriedia acidiceleris TaxID=371036 RepID=UPI003B58616E